MGWKYMDIHLQGQYKEQILKRLIVKNASDGFATHPWKY